MGGDLSSFQGPYQDSYPLSGGPTPYGMEEEIAYPSLMGCKRGNTMSSLPSSLYCTPHKETFVRPYVGAKEEQQGSRKIMGRIGEGVTNDHIYVKTLGRGIFM